MSLLDTVPRRSVNLPRGALGLLLRSILNGSLQDGPSLQSFSRRFGEWLGTPYVFGTRSGRSAFQLTLEALNLEQGKEIIFPVFTFPVMPMVAKLLGYRPVFCEVDPQTFNAGPEHIEPKINANTGAVLATHIFGQPCPIREIAALTARHGIRLLEDCAHACGVRVSGQQVGTFGDVGIFSFAEGKNMPCFGGGTIATADGEIAERARSILQTAPVADTATIALHAFSIWLKWLATQPPVFGLTAYPILRLNQAMHKPLLDSTVGDELLEQFSASQPRVSRMANLQAAMGLLQLKHIDAFNQGARQNAKILTEHLGNVPGVQAPKMLREDHVYVYYPLTVEPAKRDDLRNYLLRHGVDGKITDMTDCSRLKYFRTDSAVTGRRSDAGEASLLEICVYPTIHQRQMKRIAKLIRSWAGLSELN